MDSIHNISATSHTNQQTNQTTQLEKQRAKDTAFSFLGELNNQQPQQLVESSMPVTIDQIIPLITRLIALLNGSSSNGGIENNRDEIKGTASPVLSSPVSPTNNGNTESFSTSVDSSLATEIGDGFQSSLSVTAIGSPLAGEIGSGFQSLLAGNISTNTDTNSNPSHWRRGSASFSLR